MNIISEILLPLLSQLETLYKRMNTMNTRSQTNAIILGCLNKINNNSSSKKEMKRENENENEKGKPLYPVDINFDEASKDWHLNKRRQGHEYIYICLETIKPEKTDKSGKTKICGKKCYQYNSTCFIHRNRNK